MKKIQESPAQNPAPYNAAFSYARYLSAKETLDERSLSRYVWDTFVHSMGANTGKDLRILEVGGGIGATFRRIISAQLRQNLHYTLLDNEAENLGYFQSNIDGWMHNLGYTRELINVNRWSNLMGRRIEVDLALADVHGFIGAQHGAKQDAVLWDVIVAQAFLDLFNLETFLPALFSLLKRRGIFYFPINFDGITSFLPQDDPEIDQLVEAIYHASMDARAVKPALKGCSQSGRFLLASVQQLNVDILAAGSSDWVVYPQANGYCADEKYFLFQILEFVRKELAISNKISPETARDWVQRRKQQLKNDELIYLAHQIDILGQLI